MKESECKDNSNELKERSNLDLKLTLPRRTETISTFKNELSRANDTAHNLGAASKATLQAPQATLQLEFQNSFTSSGNELDLEINHLTATLGKSKKAQNIVVK